MRIAAGIAFGVFALSIAVQWNDPDPWPWVLGYGLPAALAAAVLAGRRDVRLSGGLALLYTLVFVYWSPALAGLDRDAVSQIGMKSLQAEEAREAGGLAICWAWCVAVFVADWRASDRRARNE